MPELRSEYRPYPVQWAFHQSKAKIRGYGGAMGGGKSRAGCEEVFDNCLDFPGLVAVVARDSHTSIVETTKKTMLGQVVPSELIVRKKESMGEDFIELFNGSKIHFIGLDDPYRWYSSELGFLFFDEAHEIDEEKVLRLITRLRQPGNMPCRAIVTFNPANPGHWLQRWFLKGGERTDWGFRKDEFVVGDAESAIGSCEFFFAKATDNIYLPAGYVEQTLAGLPKHLRRRYLEGIWEFITGNNFFDAEALMHYQVLGQDTKALFNGRTEGDVFEDFRAKQLGRKAKEPIKFRRGSGPWTVWKPPVRKNGDTPGHRYVMAVDVSSGGSYDYSAIQILDVEEFEQVAEFQGKITPTDLALEAYRAGRIYNNALAVPETTGGWGVTIEQELKRLHYSPLYTRRILDRLSQKWTDRTGWDTNTKTRPLMLDTLDRVLREKTLGLYSLRTVDELSTFVYDDRDRPTAQEGMNDDLVMALAIAVKVALDRPKELRRIKQEPHVPVFAKTGY